MYNFEGGNKNIIEICRDVAPEYAELWGWAQFLFNFHLNANRKKDSNVSVILKVKNKI